MSASSMGRYAACPASFLRSRWMPDETSEAAERGTRIHDALADGDTTKLWHDEEMAKDQCDRIVETITREHILSCLIDENEVGEVSRETRVQSFLGPHRFSGQWDLVTCWKESEVLLVADYKTGPRGAESADENLQLASLAFLAEQKFKLPKTAIVFVAIVSPLKSPQYTIAKYTVEQLDAVYDELSLVAEASHNPYAEAKAGDHCRYCPARNACPERNELVGEVATVTAPSAITDPRKFADLLNMGDLASTAHKEHRDIAKQLLKEERIVIPGWKLQESKGRETIKAEQLISKMADEGYLAKMLGTMVSVTKKGLLAVVRTKTGKSGKELEEETKRLLAGCVKEGAPTVRLVKQ